MSDRYDAVVIGGGHNGLTAAAVLAKQGRKTLVLERRQVLGGLAAGEEFHPGYRTAGVLHDTSAVRSWLIEDLELSKHGLALRAEAPPVLVPQQDGAGLLLWRDPGKARDELARISPADADKYADLRAFLGRVAPALGRLSESPPPDIFDTGWRDLLSLGRSALALRRLGKREFLEVLRILPTSVADWLGEWFKSELLKAALAAPAIWGTWTGPHSPGSTANLLLAETAAGAPVVGGARALVAALEKAARAYGVEIRVGAAVERLAVSDDGVSGVRLRDGEEIRAGAVLASCDPKRLFLRHLPAERLSQRLGRDIGNFRTRGTSAKVNLALSAYPEFACRPGLEAESVRTGESLEQQERAFDAVKFRRFSDRPVLDVQVPTLETPELAPPGHHVFSILVHFAPHDLAAGWDEGQNERLFGAVLAVLSDYAPGVEDLVVGRQVLSPRDLETEYAVTGGHLHHGEHATDQLIVRPTPECARYATPLAGLYLCGSGSHPGGGLTCAPGALGARAVLAR